MDKLREAFELAKSLANAKYSPDLPEETAPQVLEERADLSRRLRVIMVFMCMGLGGDVLVAQGQVRLAYVLDDGRPGRLKVAVGHRAVRGCDLVHHRHGGRDGVS